MSPAEPAAKRAAIFIDGQNLFHAARDVSLVLATYDACLDRRDYRRPDASRRRVGGLAARPARERHGPGLAPSGGARGPPAVKARRPDDPRGGAPHPAPRRPPPAPRPAARRPGPPRPRLPVRGHRPRRRLAARRPVHPLQALPAGRGRRGPRDPLLPAPGDTAPALRAGPRSHLPRRPDQTAPDHRGREEGAKGGAGGPRVPGCRRALELAGRRPTHRRPRPDRLVRAGEPDRPGLGRLDAAGSPPAGIRAWPGARGARRESRRAEAPAGPGRRESRPRRLPLLAPGRCLRGPAAASAEARGLQPDERLVARLGEAGGGASRHRVGGDRARPPRAVGRGSRAPSRPGRPGRRPLVRPPGRRRPRPDHLIPAGPSRRPAPAGARPPPHRARALHREPGSRRPLAHHGRVGIGRPDPRRPRRLLHPLRRPPRPADGPLARRLGARDLVLPGLPRLPVSLDPLGREALRQEPPPRAPGPGRLQRLAGHGAPNRGPALPGGPPGPAASSSWTRWRPSGATRTASTPSSRS
jgi:hypothetical protein